MNVIGVQAFPTILISLTALGLAGCIPAYYTREDGRKMSDAERKSLCERLDSRTKFRCETQPANMQGLCYEVNKNAAASLANLECHRFDPAVAEYQAMRMQGLMAKFELSRAMNIPSDAGLRIPDKWTWESMDYATLDMTGTEWETDTGCILGCPKTLRFLPQGRLVVSRDWVIYAKSLGKLPEYGRAEEGRWSQKQRRIYLQFKVEKPGEKDPKVVTFHGFGQVNGETRAELTLEASESGEIYSDLGYNIRRR
jgi:hypothetical protein